MTVVEPEAVLSNDSVNAVDHGWPELLRGGIIRRGFALFVDLIVVEVILQLLVTVIFPLSGGVLTDTNSVFTSCVPTEQRLDSATLPPSVTPTGRQICTKSIFGLPTARFLVATGVEPGTQNQQTVTAPIDSRGQVVHVYDLADLQLVALVLMRWTLDRIGWTSLGRRFLSLRVWPIAPPAMLAAAINRRYALFGLPLVPGLILSLLAAINDAIGTPVGSQVFTSLAFLTNLPQTVASFAAIGAIVRGRDAFYDAAAGTAVLRFVQGAAVVAPEGARPIRHVWTIAPIPTAAPQRGWPWMTLGLAALLGAIFIAELAVTRAGGAPVPVSALIAWGSVDGEFVHQLGQWYRLVTSMGLHGGIPHIIGNLGVLLAAGWFLETVIGSGWFLAVFLMGGLAGALASTTFNPPTYSSVGASGAITALLAAGFVITFRLPDTARRLWTRSFCLAGLLAALTAAGKFAWGMVDQADHFGGATGGVAMGLVMIWSWRSGTRRPPRETWAGFAAAGIAAALFLSIPFTGFGDPLMTALMIPPDQMPKTDAEWSKRADDLAKRYPADPRSHLARAIAVGGDASAREAEIQLAIRTQRRVAPANAAASEQEVYTVVGEGRLNARDWAAARDLFTRAIDTKPPGSTKALDDRASAEQALGLFDLGLRDLETLGQMQPTNDAVAIERSDLLFDSGRPDDAVANLETVTARTPDNGLAWRQRGWIGFFGSHRDAALPALEKAVSLTPTDAYAALWLDIVAVRTGSADRLKGNIRRLDSTAWPAPVVQYYLGGIDAAALDQAALNPDLTKQADQQCEVAFYRAEFQLMRRADGVAQPFLADALKICPKSFYEWAAAKAEWDGKAGFRKDEGTEP